MDSRRIAIIGSGELARRLIYYIEETGFGTIAGLFDDFEPIGTIKHNHPVLGKLSDIPSLFHNNLFDQVLICIGYNHLSFRKTIFKQLKTADVPVATFIHPTAHIDKSAVISDGCIILVKCVIDMKSVIEENVLISSNSFISHDVKISAHTFCGPALNIAGRTQIGECCFIGINSTTIDNISIGNHSITGAGSVITKDVPSNVLAAGVPAVIKKTLKAVP